MWRVWTEGKLEVAFLAERLVGPVAAVPYPPPTAIATTQTTGIIGADQTDPDGDRSGSSYVLSMEKKTKQSS